MAKRDPLQATHAAACCQAAATMAAGQTGDETALDMLAVLMSACKLAFVCGDLILARMFVPFLQCGELCELQHLIHKGRWY
jgi:hypothetical protein